MKILQLISSNGFFGAEKVMLELSKQIQVADYKSHIGMIGRLQGEVLREAEKNKIEAKLFNCNGKFSIKTIIEIRKFIKENEIVIVHSHGYKSNFYGLFASIGIKTKKIATCHNWLGDNVKMKFYEHLDRFLLRKFDKVVAVSEDIRRKIIRSSVSEEKVTLINNGIDIDRFKIKSEKSKVKKSLGIGEDEKVIGTVGRLSEEKGHIYLLEAFEKVVKEFPSTKLLIVGDGPLRESLKSKVKSQNLEEKVIFTGVRNDIPELLSAMDIFVLPSLKEGMPMALLEAMAAKIPVIATKVGGVPKLIDGENNYMLIEPGNVNHLYNSILGLLQSKKKVSFLTEKGYEIIKNEFSARKMTMNYIEIYEDLTENNEMLIKNRSKFKIPVLMYHEVADYSENKKNNRYVQTKYCITPSKFEKQLLILKANKFESVLIDKENNLLNLPQKVVAITFDDGFIGNFKYALPLLKKYGYKGIFFITVKLIGKDNYMNWDDLIELEKAGMSIQSHSLEHKPLITLTKNEVEQQLGRSKEILEDKLHVSIDCLGFPHGSYNKFIISQAENYGYKKFFDSDINYYKGGKIIPRYVVSSNLSNNLFLKFINGREEVIFLPRLAKFCRDTFKKIIGISLYRKIYRKVFKINYNQ